MEKDKILVAGATGYLGKYITRELLSAHGVARACVESVAENLTDAVLSTLFWAGIGLVLLGYPGAAALALAHRACNMLNAMWLKHCFHQYVRRIALLSAFVVKIGRAHV